MHSIQQLANLTTRSRTDADSDYIISHHQLESRIHRATAYRIVEDAPLERLEELKQTKFWLGADDYEILAATPASHLKQVATADGITRLTAIRELRRKLSGITAWWGARP
jgi:hypothetical protein